VTNIALFAQAGDGRVAACFSCSSVVSTKSSTTDHDQLSDRGDVRYPSTGLLLPAVQRAGQIQGEP
jgi:hypothetical protein